MQMLYAFSGSIQQYIERVGSSEEAARCRPATCPQCESQRPLGCHGFYKRTVVDLDVEYVIQVRRYLCGACRRTVSLLPEFVLPYLRFAIVVMAAFLKARLCRGQTHEGGSGDGASNGHALSTWATVGGSIPVSSREYIGGAVGIGAAYGRRQFR